MKPNMRHKNHKERAVRAIGKLIADCGTRLVIEALAESLRARHPGYGPAESDARDIEEIARRWTDWQPETPDPAKEAADAAH